MTASPAAPADVGNTDVDGAGIDAPGVGKAGFAALGLNAALCAAAHAAGWTAPTAIQRAAIPPIVQGRDVLAQAATGAGKTAAFLLPLLQRLGQQAGAAEARPRRLFALVLSPTRELAAQTGAVAALIAPQFKTVVAVGGLSVNPQMMALRGGAHVLVATPGRLLDLTRQNAVRLADVQAVVLDEADRLLDAGFIDETRRVLALLPRPRQTLLFSATLPAAVAALADGGQTDALRIEVAAAEAAPKRVFDADAPALPPDSVARAAPAPPPGTVENTAPTPPPSRVDGAAPALPPGIAQRAIVVDSARRTPLLRHLIAAERWHRLLVFVATQHAADHVADKLRQAGLPAAALHGELSPLRRTQALADLAAGRLQVLVATDLASRGLDLPRVDAVVQHDLPRSATDHIHRIGRTARAGAAGTAVAFVLADAPGSEAHFRLIEKRQGQRVARETVPGFEPANGVPDALRAHTEGGVKGRRKSRKDKLREAAAQG